MLASEIWADLGNSIATEKKMKMIRVYRQVLLSNCDWTQLPDAVLTFDEKTKYQIYRQELRDLPNTITNPDNVVFPVLGVTNG